MKPILEHAAIIWLPYIQKDIDKVEQVQRRAVRFIFNNYSYLASVSEMLIDLNWATLAHYRKEQKAMLLHKIVHHLVDIPSNNYLIYQLLHLISPEVTMKIFAATTHNQLILTFNS